MTVGLNVTIRNSRVDLIKTAIDAGAGAGLLRIYDGTRPATGGAATTLLATLTCSDPSAPAAAAGVLTLNAITNGTGVAAATATWARFVDSTGAHVLDCSVGTAGADINLNTTTISIGVTVSVTSAVFTAGNP